MILRSTPHIKLRKANGLINIDYTACDILFNEKEGTAAARSYNTIIGVYCQDKNNNKIYLETAGSYSQTTATKHKPRAAALAAYNNYKIIENVRPETLHNLYYYADYNLYLLVEEILKESQQRNAIIKELQNNDETGRQILAAKKAGTIKARKKPESKDYKNGNRQTKYYYVVKFKYLAPVYYELNQKAIKRIVRTRNGEAVTHDYLYNIVNIEV